MRRRNEYSESESESESSESIDFELERFGNDPLVCEVRFPDRVRELCSEGIPVTPRAVFAATATNHADTLEILLDNGGNPNIRLEEAAAKDEVVAQGWSSRDVPIHFGHDRNQWYPLQFMTTIHRTWAPEDRARQLKLVTLLVNRGADIYATYSQPIRLADPFPFPGDENDYQGECATNEDEYESQPPVTFTYGTRTVIHSIFEDGGYIQPFVDGTFQLDLEHRDPQGRTILQSACRSGLGADSVIEGELEDAWESAESGYRGDPFVASDDRPSIFHVLRLQGADLEATDYHGKNIVHHLLEAEDPRSPGGRPAIIKDTLKYVLAHLPALVNQSDMYGTYPLHSALQRCRSCSRDNQDRKRAEIESAVENLLSAGADPKARDGRGNTALHYLADSGVADRLEGKKLRPLFKKFIDLGIDVNIRNNSGRTALEILLDPDSALSYSRWGTYSSEYIRRDILKEENTNAEVLGWFVDAGAKLYEKDSRGQNFLHIVARRCGHSAAPRTLFFLSKGIAPDVKDVDGKTAIDIAKAHENTIMLSVLKGAGWDEEGRKRPRRECKIF